MDDIKKIKFKTNGATPSELVEFLNQLGEAASNLWGGLSKDEKAMLEVIKGFVGNIRQMVSQLNADTILCSLLVEFLRSINKEEEAQSFVNSNMKRKWRELSELLEGQGTEVAKA